MVSLCSTRSLNRDAQNAQTCKRTGDAGVDLTSPETRLFHPVASSDSLEVPKGVPMGRGEHPLGNIVTSFRGAIVMIDESDDDAHALTMTPRNIMYTTRPLVISLHNRFESLACTNVISRILSLRIVAGTMDDLIAPQLAMTDIRRSEDETLEPLT